jgi:hypothetical protein
LLVCVLTVAPASRYAGCTHETHGGTAPGCPIRCQPSATASCIACPSAERGQGKMETNSSELSER